jgi:membrane associated rhomboid family serine protease
MDRLRHAPVTLILIGINLALFLSEEIFNHFFASSLLPYLALSREGLATGSWWQVITYAFLHGSPFHLLVNMVALCFTGPLLEEILGPVCYLGLFIGGALAGGLLQTLVSSSDAVLVGASGSVCALLVGFATLFPNLEITALIFFVIPVRMRASILGWIVVLGSFFLWIFKIEQQIGHLAHLGGGIAGFMICRIYKSCGLVRRLSDEM